jgi:Spy/CpxP family protein refolding chaperone
MNRSKRFVLGTLLGGLAAGVSWRAFAHGGGHHGWGMGAGPIDPAAMNEHIERFIKHLAVEIDATPDQQQRLAAIAKSAAQDLLPIRNQAREARKQAIALFSAPTVDRQALETLRVAQIERADTASRRLVQALSDAADVLTVEQRKRLAEHVERHSRGWHRG